MPDPDRSVLPDASVDHAGARPVAAGQDRGIGSTKDGPAVTEGGSRPDGSRISVVVITWNRRSEALATVDRLRSLPERPPVVVVDNGSRDGTAAAVRAAHRDVEVVALPGNLGAAGRNVGAEAATTPYVAFADDDSTWEPGALGLAADLFDRHPRLAVLAARVVVGDDGRLDPTCAAMAASPLPAEADLPGPPVLGFVACGAVVHRRRFLELGGFDARYGVGGEETPFALEAVGAGWGVAYVDAVVARHHPSSTRDPAGRRRVAARNHLWLTWTRRRWPAVATETARTMARAAGDGATRAGLVEAARALGWVTRARRAVPPDLERRLRLLDRQRRTTHVH